MSTQKNLKNTDVKGRATIKQKEEQQRHNNKDLEWSKTDCQRI